MCETDARDWLFSICAAQLPGICLCDWLFTLAGPTDSEIGPLDEDWLFSVTNEQLPTNGSCFGDGWLTPDGDCWVSPENAVWVAPE